MPVPDYQTFMAPVLRALEDGEPRSIGQIRELVAAEMGTTDEERAEVVKSGIGVFDSRVGWAVTYMAQAGLVRRPRRAVNQITDRGREILRAHPDRVDSHILMQFEEFRDFKNRTRTRVDRDRAARMDVGVTITADGVVEGHTPRETITVAVEENNTAVASDILNRVRERDPAFLENLVLKVLTAMGYAGAAGSAEHLGRSGDEGLDGVIKQDKLGLDRIYVQAKRYAADRTVGRPDIQGFVGALHGAQADRGVFITTSRFSPDAYSYAEKVQARIILIDGQELAKLLVDHNIGAQDSETFVLKRVDEDFFEEI
jgi:restriction system protein